MIQRYGEAAQFECTKRADDLAAEGDRIGMRIWVRVAESVAFLSGTSSTGPSQ